MNKPVLVTITISAITLVILLVLFFAEVRPVSYLDKAGPLTEEDSRAYAADTILQSATYSLDGSELTFVETVALRCPYCWSHTFYFYSDYLGFGGPDERGELVAYRNPHIARVIINDKEIASFTIDDAWDELRSEFT